MATFPGIYPHGNHVNRGFKPNNAINIIVHIHTHTYTRIYNIR